MAGGRAAARTPRRWLTPRLFPGVGRGPIKARTRAARRKAWGLRCRSARGGLDELRRLNRPAVLLMRDDQGREFHAALVALAGKSATFASASRPGPWRWTYSGCNGGQ